MEVVRLSGAPPSRRVRPQSHNPRSKGGQSQGSPKNPAKTALVVQIPNNTGYINSMGSPKQGRIFNTEPDYRALPPSRGTRSGSPCCGRAGSPSRFGGRCGTSESNVMRQSPNMMARPTSPAEQRQTINELINKTNFYLEVLENPNPQERHVNKSKANRLLHHIDSCQHELQEAGRVLHPAARVPKARPKSALSVSLSTLTAKDMIMIDRFPPDRRALYSPIKHWNTAYKDTFMTMEDRMQKIRAESNTRKI